MTEIQKFWLLVFSVLAWGSFSSARGYFRDSRKNTPAFAKLPLAIQLLQASVFGVITSFVFTVCLFGLLFVVVSLPSICLGAIKSVSHVAGSVTKAAVDGYENGRR